MPSANGKRSQALSTPSPVRVRVRIVAHAIAVRIRQVVEVADVERRRRQVDWFGHAYAIQAARFVALLLEDINARRSIMTSARPIADISPSWAVP